VHLAAVLKTATKLNYVYIPAHLAAVIKPPQNGSTKIGAHFLAVQ